MNKKIRYFFPGSEKIFLVLGIFLSILGFLALLETLGPAILAKDLMVPLLSFGIILLGLFVTKLPWLGNWLQDTLEKILLGK